MTIGTPMKAPNRPQRNVQKKTASSTTEGDMASIGAGHARLDIAADHELDDVEADEDADDRLPRSNCVIATKVGNSVATKGPMNGM